MRIITIFITVLGLFTVVYGQVDCATDNLIYVKDLTGNLSRERKSSYLKRPPGKFALNTNKVKDGAYLFKDLMGQFHDDQGKSWGVGTIYFDRRGPGVRGI
jgi:hypothetical protein